MGPKALKWSMRRSQKWFPGLIPDPNWTRLIWVCICDWIVIGCGTESVVGWLFGIRNFTNPDSQNHVPQGFPCIAFLPLMALSSSKKLTKAHSLAGKDGYSRWDQRVGKLARIFFSDGGINISEPQGTGFTERARWKGLRVECLRCLTWNWRRYLRNFLWCWNRCLFQFRTQINTSVSFYSTVWRAEYQRLALHIDKMFGWSHMRGPREFMGAPADWAPVAAFEQTVKLASGASSEEEPLVTAAGRKRGELRGVAV